MKQSISPGIFLSCNPCDKSLLAQIMKQSNGRVFFSVAIRVQVIKSQLQPHVRSEKSQKILSCNFTCDRKKSKLQLMTSVNHDAIL